MSRTFSSTAASAPSSSSNKTTLWKGASVGCLAATAAFGCAAATLGYQLASIRAKRAQRDEERLNEARLYNADPLQGDVSSLPPSTLSPNSLSHIELGSDALRSLFFLSDRGGSSNGLRVAHVNHGSFGTVPRPVMNYFYALLRQVEAAPDVWKREHAYILTRHAIKTFASILRCKPESLVFVANATTAVNAVLMSTKFGPGDVVLGTDCTYHACKLAMAAVAKAKGAEYREVKIKMPIASAEAVVKMYEDEIQRVEKGGKKVAFALVDPITSPTAIAMPYRALAELLRKHDAICMLDAAHSTGQLEMDFSEFDYDYATTNLHKWLYAPKGCALLYASPRLRESVHPLIVSHETASSYTKRWWWLGTQDESAYLASVEGARFAEAIGVERSKKYCAELMEWASNHIIQALHADNATESSSSSSSSSSPIFICPPSLSSPNMRLIRLPWSMPAAASSDVDRARRADVIMRHVMLHDRVSIPIIYESHTQSFWIRISVQIYNNKQDYIRLTEALLRIPQEYPELLA